MKKQTQQLSCSTHLEKRQDMRDENTKTQIKKLWDNTHPLSFHPHPDMNQPCPPLHLFHPHIIPKNNRMDTEFLRQLKLSNKCGSVRNDEPFNLHMGSGAGPWVSIPCFLQDTSHIYWFHPSKQLTRKKQGTQKWDPTPNKSYHTTSLYVRRTQGLES